MHEQVNHHCIDIMQSLSDSILNSWIFLCIVTARSLFDFILNSLGELSLYCHCMIIVWFYIECGVRAHNSFFKSCLSRTAAFLMRHLSNIASHGARTGMHCKNLAIVWAPNLLRWVFFFVWKSSQVKCSSDLWLLKQVQIQLLRYISKWTCW